MKKVILSTALALTLSVGTPVFAEESGTIATAEQESAVETGTTTEGGVTPTEPVTTETAGTTPDSFFYTFDLLMEDIRLLVTFNPEKEAELLLKFAQERLAEAMVMTKAEKTAFVEKAVTEYLALLKQVEEKVTEVIMDEEVKEEVKTELTDSLKDTAEATEPVAEQLSPEQKAEVEATIDQAYLVAQSVAGFDVEVVKSLREQKYGYGQISKIISLANISGKSIEEVTSLLGEEADFGQVMKELDVNIHQVKQQIVAQKMGSVEAYLEAAKARGDEKAAAKLEKKLENLNKKNDRLVAKAGNPDSDEDKEEVTEGEETELVIEGQPQAEASTEGTAGTESAVSEGATPVVATVASTTVNATNSKSVTKKETKQKGSKQAAAKEEQKQMAKAVEKKQEAEAKKKAEKPAAEAAKKQEKEKQDKAKKEEKKKERTSVKDSDEEEAEVVITEEEVEDEAEMEESIQGKKKDNNKVKGNKDENKGKGGK
jgi:hypothetical protein